MGVPDVVPAAMGRVFRSSELLIRAHAVFLLEDVVQ
jgi:hypothetical protein